MKTIYTAQASARGGRHGTVATDDQKLSLSLTRPVEMGGDGSGTNPEQLFACGYAACFASTIDFLSKQEKLDLGPIEVSTRVSLGKLDGEGYGLSAELDVSLPGVEPELAERIVDKAKRNCPYSNATRGNVETIVRIVKTA
ncbi:MAG: organic hydroperoxide resistance protein [Mesorhizobium sp.]